MEHGGKFGTAEQSKTTFEAIFLMLNTKKAAELRSKDQKLFFHSKFPGRPFMKWSGVIQWRLSGHSE
jgi:hypothetical protein